MPRPGDARDLRRFYLFRLLATSYLWQPIFIFFMAARGLSFGQVMLLWALYNAVVIAVEIPTGALADRMGRRVTLMAGTLAMVASCLVAYGSHSFAMFAVAESLSAISLSLCSGADSAYLFDWLAGRGRLEEYPEREARSSAWHLFGTAAACAAGGLLGEIDLGLPYLVTAVVSLAAFVAAFGLGNEHVERATTPVRIELRQYLATMRAGVADVRNSRRLMWVMGLSALVFVLIRATTYLYQPYLRSRGYGLAATGLIFAAVNLVAALVAQRGTRLRDTFGEAPLTWMLLGALGGSFLLLDRLSGPWALVGLGIQAAVTGLYSPLTKPMLNREITGSGHRATVLSIESIARRAGALPFSLVAALLAASSAIVLCGVIGMVGLAVLALTARHSPATWTRLGSLGGPTRARGVSSSGSPSVSSVDD